MPDDVANGSRRSGAPAQGLGPERLAPALAGRVRPSPGRPRWPRSRLGHREHDQEVAELDRLPRPRPRPARRSPSRGARSSFCIFIASTTRSRLAGRRRHHRPDRHRDDPSRDDGTDLESARRAAVRRAPGSPAREGRARPASSTSSSNRQPSTTTSTAVGRRGRGGRWRRAGRPGRSPRRRRCRIDVPRPASIVRGVGRRGRVGRRRPGRVIAGPPIGRALIAGQPVDASRRGRGRRRAVEPASVGRRSTGRGGRRPAPAPSPVAAATARPPHRRPPPATRGPLGGRPSHSLGDPAGRQRRPPGTRRARRRTGGTAGSSGSRRSRSRRGRGAAGRWRRRGRGVDHDLGDQRVVVGRRPGRRPRRRCRPGRPDPPASPSGRSGPGAGAKSRAGSSAERRTSIAWPVGSVAAAGGGQRPRRQRPPGREPGAARGRCRAGDRAR